MTEATMPVTVEQGLAGEFAELVTFGGEVGSTLVPAEMSKRILAALNTRATPPPPAGLAGEQIARIIEPNAFGSDLGLPDATVSKLAALDKADRILTALTANASQPDRVVDVLPAALAEQACLIGKSGTTVTIECDDYDEALAVFDWITTLLSTLDAKDQSNG